MFLNLVVVTGKSYKISDPQITVDFLTLKMDTGVLWLKSTLTDVQKFLDLTVISLTMVNFLKVKTEACATRELTEQILGSWMDL